MYSPADLGMNFIDPMSRPDARVTDTRGAGLVISPTIASAISSGSAFLRNFAPEVPEVSSVLVNVGKAPG